MEKDELKALIEEIVNSRNGIKATELAAMPEVAKAVGALDFPGALNDLVEEGRIVEVDYTVPDLPKRIKSFLLPVGSIVLSVKNAEVEDGG